MNLTSCSKSCPYQSDGRCIREEGSRNSRGLSSIHDCPSCPYLSSCLPPQLTGEKTAGRKKHRKKNGRFSCILEDGML